MTTNQLYDEFVCRECNKNGPGECCIVKIPVSKPGNSSVPRLTCNNGHAVWKHVGEDVTAELLKRLGR